MGEKEKNEYGNGCDAEKQAKGQSHEGGEQTGQQSFMNPQMMSQGQPQMMHQQEGQPQMMQQPVQGMADQAMLHHMYMQGIPVQMPGYQTMTMSPQFTQQPVNPGTIQQGQPQMMQQQGQPQMMQQEGNPQMMQQEGQSQMNCHHGNPQMMQMGQPQMPQQGQPQMMQQPVQGPVDQAMLQHMYMQGIPVQMPQYSMPGYFIPPMAQQSPFTQHSGHHPGSPGSGGSHHHASDPKQLEERYGQMIKLMDDVVNGNASISSFANFFDFKDTEFWKGVLIGTSVVLLLTSDTVKTTLFKTAAKATEGVKTGVEKIKKTAAETKKEGEK